jgi:hypothetical protein
MGLFSNLSNSKVQGRGKKILETGEFVIRIDTIKLQESNQDFGTMWIVEFTILKGTENNPRASERSWVQMPEHGKRKKTDPGNIKQFMGSVLGDESDDPAVPEEAFEYATSEANPHSGTILRLSTDRVKTKDGFDFTVHNWSPCLAADHDLELAPGETAQPAPAMPQAAPAAPPVPLELTQAQWAAGAGEGTTHPENPAYEYNPQHIDWGTRLKV